MLSFFCSMSRCYLSCWSDSSHRVQTRVILFLEILAYCSVHFTFCGVFIVSPLYIDFGGRFDMTIQKGLILKIALKSVVTCYFVVCAV